MENNPVAKLMQEHETIEHAIQSALKLRSLTNQPEQYLTEINKHLIFFQKYSDEYHHSKEENILFPALIHHPDFKLNEIIDELNEHHENFRNYTHEIKECINEKRVQDAQTILERYTNDLRDHIAIENDELFVLCENLFSADELEKMYFLFEDVDRDLGLQQKIDLEEMNS